MTAFVWRLVLHVWNDRLATNASRMERKKNSAKEETVACVCSCRLLTKVGWVVEQYRTTEDRGSKWVVVSLSKYWVSSLCFLTFQASLPHKIPVFFLLLILLIMFPIEIPVFILQTQSCIERIWIVDCSHPEFEHTYHFGIVGIAWSSNTASTTSK